MTKKETAKFVEYLLSRDSNHNSLNQKLIAELVNGSKTWADRLQKPEIVQMAEQLTGAGQQVPLPHAATYGRMQSADDTFMRATATMMPGGFSTMQNKPGNLVSAMGPTEFLYEFDFDENGALFYLGSHGKKKIWQNPHVLGQVEAFSSALGSGSVTSVVGRSVANLRTIDEPLSFFGVDLGTERRLLPTCYTLRNRGSGTHVL